MAFSLTLTTALAALALAASAANLPGRQFVSCQCSQTNRGYRKGAFDDLTAAVDDLVNQERQMRNENPRPAEQNIRTQIDAMAIEKWESCTDSYSVEECVNADVALRRGACWPNCASVCYYNRGTFKTISGGRINAVCTGVFASQDQEFVSNRQGNADFRPTPTNPHPGRRGRVQNTGNSPQGFNGNNNGRFNNGRNNGFNNNNNNPNGQGFVDQNGNFNNTGDLTNPNGRREGCVAVEHLEGYVLQHRSNLWRHVLCAKGFCATPNHAIIVKGELTSMKLLCKSKWACVRSMKWVNNLKLYANRRAVVNELVTVTPYDLRFPKVAIWAVQMLEDAFELAVFSGFLGVAAIAAVLAGAKGLSNLH